MPRKYRSHTTKRRQTKEKMRRSKRMRRSKTMKLTKNIMRTINLQRSKNMQRARHMQRNMGMHGGSGHSPLGGSPYNIDNGGNYYTLSPNGAPSGAMDPPVPSTAVKMSGGKSKRGKSKRGKYIKVQRGGNFLSTLVPHDALNVFRSIPAAAGHMFDRFNGVISSPSSQVYPTDQPVALKNINSGNNINITPPNINKFYTDAQTAAAAR